MDLPRPWSDRTGPARVPDCVALESLYESSLVSITAWRCLYDGRALREERFFDSPVLTIVHAGASVCHVGKRSYIVEPSRVSFRSPGVPHSTSHPFGCGDYGVNIGARHRFLREAIARYGGRRDGPVRFPVATAPAPMRPLLRLRLLVRKLRSGVPVGSIEAEECLFRFIDESLAAAYGAAPSRLPRAADAETEKDRERWAEETRAILFRSYREPLRLEDLGEAVGVSPFHLARVFRAATGVPIHRTLTRVRLLAALERIAEGETDLTRLAIETGFSSHSHLSSTFRARLGMTPQDFRISRRNMA